MPVWAIEALGLIAGCVGTTILMYVVIFWPNPEDLGRLVSIGRSALVRSNAGPRHLAGQAIGGSQRSSAGPDRPMETR